MNKIIKILIVLVLTISVFSCESNEEINKAENSNIVNLKKDARFVSLLNNEIALIDNIRDLNKVESILSKGDLTNEDANKLAVALGFSNADEYVSYIERQNMIQTDLENEYQLSKIDPLKLEEIAIESSAYTEVLKNDPCNCNRIGRDCILIAGAAAVVGHIGCAGADVTILLGIACHAAVAAGHAAANDMCLAQAENCKNDCNR